MKKICVVGGVAGGASAAARARRIDPSAQIVVFERGEHVSYSNCCLPYHLSGTVAKSESLILMTPEKFKKQHDIEVRTDSEVIAINRAAKTVTVRRVLTGETYEEPYDILVLSPGAAPVRPRSIKGVDNPNVFTVRSVTDIRRLKAFLDKAEVQQTAVIGGGFIGMECAENLKEAGKQVTLIEGTNQVMAPFDYDMAQILHKELTDNGIRLLLGAKVTEITDTAVIAEKNGETVSAPAQAVVLAIGVAPETALAKDAGLDIGVTGGIKVDHDYRTSDPDIYAVGDAVESYNRLAHCPGRLALAGPAQREARAAADSMYGIPHNNNGFIGSSCLRVFSQNAACTGLNEKTAAKAGYSFDYVYVLPSDKVSLMPGSHYLCFKLLFEVPTGKILGAQAIGTGDADKRINVIAAMITMGGTLNDLKELELCYSPVYGTAKDVVNMAALVGLNVLNGVFRQVKVSDVRALAESGAYIVDVREENEYAAGHIVNAVNIPLSQLRARYGEIPKDKPVYLHCRTSQRSYYAICFLQGMGYKNVINISGSFLGISLYEYFNDKDTGRTPIVTAYNFK